MGHLDHRGRHRAGGGPRVRLPLTPLPHAATEPLIARHRFTWAALGAACLALASPGHAAEPRLAIEINEPARLSHAEAIAIARQAGATAIPLSLPWSALEPRAGAFDDEALKGALELYRRAGLRVLLSIGIADALGRQVPADLVRVRWNDSRMISRLQGFLGRLLALTEDELDYVILGHELDSYLATQPREWDDLRALADRVRTSVRQARPQAKFGVALTLGGLDDRAQRLTASHDVVAITHYVVPRAEPGDPARLPGPILDQALTFAGSRPLIVKEWGFPTGGAIGGSDRGQAEFIAASLAAWRERQARIPFFGLSRLYDDEDRECERLASDGGLGGNAAFIALQCTIGLRTTEDEPKAAWSRVRAFGRPD
ncbi:MAG: hypothetical protein FJX65_16695 [Alphaproteobacteria bacterium]|nr:hypothetical protein [Alphaproteobacteria bacterium]